MLFIIGGMITLAVFYQKHLLSQAQTLTGILRLKNLVAQNVGEKHVTDVT